MDGCGVELYWIPVGAGTSRLQQASLRMWEAIEAARARRPRATLLHSALKLGVEPGETYTVELAPAIVSSPASPAMTGPVGVRGADRFRLWRYELRCVPVESLPDEEWAIGRPVRLSGDCEMARRVMELAPTVPPHTWGRRLRGTREMWTSDSAIAWLLASCGIDLAEVAIPSGGRAPGWGVGVGCGGGGRRGGSESRVDATVSLDPLVVVRTHARLDPSR